MIEYLVIGDDGYSYIDYLDADEVEDIRSEGFQVLPIEERLESVGLTMLQVGIGQHKVLYGNRVVLNIVEVQ